MSDRSAEISAAYAAALPSLGAGHALEARLIGPAAYAARLSAARDAVNDAGLDAADGAGLGATVGEDAAPNASSCAAFCARAIAFASCDCAAP